MDRPVTAEEILRQVERHSKAYFESLQQLHTLLANQQAGSSIGPQPLDTSRDGAAPPRSEPASPRQSVSRHRSGDSHGRKISTSASTVTPSGASKTTGEMSSSDSDEDEVYYVQNLLKSTEYSHEGLRNHLKTYKFDDFGQQILGRVINDTSFLNRDTLFPTKGEPITDRSNYSAYQVWDVGTDGSLLPVDFSSLESEQSQAMAIWHAIKDINPPSKDRKNAGRITIVREPSPLLSGAVHFTHHKVFDMDEIFKHLLSTDASSADLHSTFDDTPLRQSTFVFNFEYFTIIGEDCQPADWQMADNPAGAKAGHIAITRCSSVVALALLGEPHHHIRNTARRHRKSNKIGYVYDIWSPWQVLHMQCYPDWRAATDVHDKTKHYVNGVEAFLITLLGEFTDAQKRFEDIYRAITKLITPPASFMFDSSTRDKLLFEDSDFTFCRRYFWAYQTLGLMNDSIKSIVDTYEDTFTDDVWEGTHKTLWPLMGPESARNAHYKKKLAILRKKFEKEIRNFRTLQKENEERRVEIRGLREELFTGTSIMESRKSVEATETTVQQGHNIKLLTLVSIFFLPLTFVTSVFGMTNMPTEHHYWMFGIVTAAVCIPFFVLIGSLNTTRGMKFFRDRSKAGFRTIGDFSKWLVGRGRSSDQSKRSDCNSSEDGSEKVPRPKLYTTESMQASMAMRLRRWSFGQRTNTQKSKSEVSVVEVPKAEEVTESAARSSPEVQFQQGRRMTLRYADSEV